MPWLFFLLYKYTSVEFHSVTDDRNVHRSLCYHPSPFVKCVGIFHRSVLFIGVCTFFLHFCFIFGLFYKKNIGSCLPTFWLREESVAKAWICPYVTCGYEANTLFESLCEWLKENAKKNAHTVTIFFLNDKILKLFQNKPYALFSWYQINFFSGILVHCFL